MQIVLYFQIFFRTSDEGVGVKEGGDSGERVWAGAPVPSLPQLPIEEAWQTEPARTYLYTTLGLITAVTRGQILADWIGERTISYFTRRRKRPKFNHTGNFGPPHSS